MSCDVSDKIYDMGYRANIASDATSRSELRNTPHQANSASLTLVRSCHGTDHIMKIAFDNISPCLQYFALLWRVQRLTCPRLNVMTYAYCPCQLRSHQFVLLYFLVWLTRLVTSFNLHA
jgi:hypothetical protein